MSNVWERNSEGPPPLPWPVADRLGRYRSRSTQYRVRSDWIQRIWVYYCWNIAAGDNFCPSWMYSRLRFGRASFPKAPFFSTTKINSLVCTSRNPSPLKGLERVKLEERRNQFPRALGPAARTMSAVITRKVATSAQPPVGCHHLIARRLSSSQQKF